MLAVGKPAKRSFRLGALGPEEEGVFPFWAPPSFPYWYLSSTKLFGLGLSSASVRRHIPSPTCVSVPYRLRPRYVASRSPLAILPSFARLRFQPHLATPSRLDSAPLGTASSRDVPAILGPRGTAFPSAPSGRCQACGQVTGSADPRRFRAGSRGRGRAGLCSSPLAPNSPSPAPQPGAATV